MRKKRFCGWLLLLALCFMMATLPALGGWLKNQTQAYAQDLILPLILSFITSFIISLIFLKRFSKNRFAGLIGIFPVIAIFSRNYQSILSMIYPGLDQNSLIGIVFSLAFSVLLIFLGLSLAFAVDKYTPSWHQRTLVFYKGISVALIVTFAIQIIFLSYALTPRWPAYFYRPGRLALTATKVNLKPDIYYIVLDRYASGDILRKQFKFDNLEFENYLKANNFYLASDAMSNYPYTAMSISATLGANYHANLIQKFAGNKNQTATPYYDLIKYSPVISQLKDLGYTYDFLGSWYEATNAAPLADNVYQPEGQLTVFDHTFTLNGFSKIILTNSFFEPLVRNGITIGKTKILAYSGISEADATVYKLDNLKRLADQPSGGRFIFAHILVPHNPYYFNSDGSRSERSQSDNVGKPIKEKYTGQIEYINTQMKDILNRIKVNSEGQQAVVVLQSDEGPYPVQLNNEQLNTSIDDELSSVDMRSWSDEDLKMKYGILAAYRVPMAKDEAFKIGGDPVNIFRLIFNSYFNADLPYLTRCYYALKDGKNHPFVYADITSRLTGKANPECLKNSDFPSK